MFGMNVAPMFAAIWSRSPYICVTSSAITFSRRITDESAKEAKIPALLTAAEAGMVTHHEHRLFHRMPRQYAVV
jgi:hypothetical protein